jgi:Trypsin-co-occurring domain 1
MAEVQRLLIEEGGETYEIYIESKESPNIASPPEQSGGRPSMGISPAVKMQQARQMIRGYAVYALSAFKEFSAAEIEEVTLKFGLKIGGSTGIPFITEGKAESNLEIEVKCKFPPAQ